MNDSCSLASLVFLGLDDSRLKISTNYDSNASVTPSSSFEIRHALKGATSRFVYLEKFSLNFSSWSFAIRVINLLHP